jgi:hypothetical protein
LPPKSLQTADLVGPLRRATGDDHAALGARLILNRIRCITITTGVNAATGLARQRPAFSPLDRKILGCPPSKARIVSAR